MQKKPKNLRNEESTCCNTCILSYKYVFIPIFYYLGVIIVFVFNAYPTATTPRNWKNSLYLRFLQYSRT